MARTPLMNMLKRAVRRAGFERRAAEGKIAPMRDDLVSRRGLLAGAGAAAAALTVPLPAMAAQARIAIIGAGLAGLSAARELKKTYGLNADVYEGDTRIGGRCYTARGIFAEGQIAEHGGELIDTDHVQIRRLAKDLGLELTDVLKATPKNTEAMYLFNGLPYNLADATKDWQPIYDLVQQQSDAIGDFSYKHSTRAAKRFDAMTISDWVRRFVPGGRRGQLGELIENAFTEENALDADQQSALCAIPTLAEDPEDNFNLYYTDSDQRFHIKGGNDQIVTLIAAELGARLVAGTPLLAIARMSNGVYRLTFGNGTGTFERRYDRVILTIPFSVMRVMVDFSQAGFRPLKVESINTLTMGASCKTQLQFTRRKWFEVGCSSEIRRPARAFNTSWDATRGQPGENGILNFFAGGTQAFQAAEIDNPQLAKVLMRQAAPLIPDLHELWNGRMIKDPWQLNPWSLGSYSTYKPGYQTTILGVEREPEGHCYFAGEHTADQNGFLNAGVETGQRAARQVARSLA